MLHDILSEGLRSSLYQKLLLIAVRVFHYYVRRVLFILIVSLLYVDSDSFSCKKLQYCQPLEDTNTAVRQFQNFISITPSRVY